MLGSWPTRNTETGPTGSWKYPLLTAISVPFLTPFMKDSPSSIIWTTLSRYFSLSGLCVDRSEKDCHSSLLLIAISPWPEQTHLSRLKKKYQWRFGTCSCPWTHGVDWSVIDGEEWPPMSTLPFIQPSIWQGKIPLQCSILCGPET